MDRADVVPDDLLAAIAARADEIEAARRLPADLARQLADAGLFRLLLPAVLAVRRPIRSACSTPSRRWRAPTARPAGV